MYRTVNQHYREKFGCKVYKLAIDGGFTCPNRDGTLDTRGCIFCAGDGSGAFAAGMGLGVRQQLEQAKALVGDKCPDGRYIAYFQAFTNTYAPVDRLRQLYAQAMEPEDIVGLAIGTRPDCLPPEVVALLGELNRIKPISVELGLQTVHEKSVAYIRRGYENGVYRDAVKRLKDAGLEVVIHYDPWWNLAAQDQATDRAHRIGQQAHVQVYKLIAKDTIEKQILDLQDKKAALMETVSGGEDGGILNMTKEELLALLEIR